MSTTIQWTDETWNPTTGCTRVSEGCRNCYIERTPPFRMNNRTFANGKAKPIMHPNRLDAPLHWKKPRRIFVNSLSDLFHEDIPREFIKAVEGVTMDCPQHIFQILTKRPERMLEFCRECDFPSNVWLGVSVENQATADERIPILLQTPAAVRFISAEPLLGPIALRNYGTNRRINWVIIGGESGPGARPCDVAWIRSIRDQCQAANVPVFVKQLGPRPYVEREVVGWPDSMTFYQDPEREGYVAILKDKKGGAIEEWPMDLQIREWPACN